MSKSKARTRAQIVAEAYADENHRVVTVKGGPGGHRLSPCEQCPWRVDQVGKFPAEAFRISAHTAYDAAFETFACHMSGAEKTVTCAGFLLKNAEHNIGARIKASDGRVKFDRLNDGGLELFESYRDMAVANGVDPNDPILARCRANNE